MPSPWALVRPISASLPAALVQMSAPAPIDVARARAQHAAYTQALRDAGVAVQVLREAPTQPDACFVEDTAVIVGTTALLTRPGAPTRRREGRAVAAALRARGLTVVPMPAPATLDGGDVLRLGDTLWIGRSTRTNSAGIQFTRELFAPLGLSVHVIDVPPSLLHLKCAASPLDATTVLVAPPLVGAFAPKREVVLPAEEAYAANVVVVTGRALVPAGFPVTAAALTAHGLHAVLLPMEELRKADGSMTCLSLLGG